MTPAPIKPTVSLEVLNQIDIRVGTILAVDDVPNSDKLLQLRVSFGDHERVIVAGMKTERANPQEIVGRQALFVVNLEPRKMRGNHEGRDEIIIIITGSSTRRRGSNLPTATASFTAQPVLGNAPAEEARARHLCASYMHT